jgi:hypothetical protein
MEVQVIYTMPYETPEDMQKVRELKSDLFNRYSVVDVCPNGTQEVHIICKDQINTACKVDRCTRFGEFSGYCDYHGREARAAMM